MSFVFPMQKVLDYRVMLEEEAKVRLSRAMLGLRNEEKRFAAIQNELQEKEGEMCQNRAMDAASRWVLENFIKGLQSDLQQSHMRLRQLHEIVNQCKEMLLERAKEKKVLEKLKEKQQERHYEAEKEHERKTNDESATLRFNMVPL